MKNVLSCDIQNFKSGLNVFVPLFVISADSDRLKCILIERQNKNSDRVHFNWKTKQEVSSLASGKMCYITTKHEDGKIFRRHFS
jgi:hypothetical protein